MTTDRVFTDGENLFVAGSKRKAGEMFREAFGGDTPRDHGQRLTEVPPGRIVLILDDDNEPSIRLRASTVAKRYAGETILAE